jgi:uncharacterized protein YfiM (DUF2279 family)
MRGIPESFENYFWADAMLRLMLAGNSTRVTGVAEFAVCRTPHGQDEAQDDVDSIGYQTPGAIKRMQRTKEANLRDAFARAWRYKNGEGWGLAWMDHLLECSELWRSREAGSEWLWTEAVWSADDD